MSQFIASLDLQVVSGVLLHWVGRAVLYGTALALVTWVLLRVPGLRARPWLHGAFWLIVLFKFLVPVGPSWSWSLASSLQGVVASWPAPEAAPAGRPAHGGEPDGWLYWLTEERDQEAAAGAAAASASGQPLSVWLAGLYLAGVVLAACRRVWSYRRLVARCRVLPVLNGPTRGLLAEACRRSGVRRVPELRVSDEASTPFLIGFIRPRLVLSPGQLARPNELEAVVLHEVAHLRRGDMVVRYLQWLAGTVLFFWPVVAWVNRRIDLVREQACDEWALRHGRLSAGEYARCLLRAVQPPGSSGWLYRPAAMAASRKTIERRIDMILNTFITRDRRSRLGLPALVGLLAWSGFVLTGAAVSSEALAQEGEDSPVKIVTEDSVIIIEQVGDEGDKTITVKVLGEEGEAVTEDIQVFTLDMNLEIGQEEDAKHKCIIVRKGADYDIHLPHKEMLGLGGLAHSFSLPDIPSLADVDQDGKVSRSERAAYLVALAMQDPSAVLEEFEWADGNDDGVLSVDEAVKLLTSPTMVKVVKKVAGEGDEIEEGVEVFIHKLHVGDHEGHQGKCVRSGGPDMEMPKVPFIWVVENISAELTTEDIAEYIEAVGELPDLPTKCKSLHHEVHLQGGDSSREHKRLKMWISSSGEGDDEEMELKVLAGEEAENVVILRGGEDDELTLEVVVEEDADEEEEETK